MPFDTFEERKFESFLMKHSQAPQAKLILIVFLLQCNKFNQAFHVYDVTKTDKEFLRRFQLEDHWKQIELLVDAYRDALPNIIISQANTATHLSCGDSITDEGTFSDIASSEFDDAESVTSNISMDITTPRKTRRTRKPSSSTDSAIRTHGMKLRSSSKKKAFK